MPSSPSPSPLHDRLHHAWRRQIVRQVVRGLGWVIAAALAVYLVGFALDRLLDLAWPTRALWLALLVGAILYVFYRGFLRGVERYRPLHLALRIEDRHPELASVLVSGIQLAASNGNGSGGSGGTGASPDLIQAVQQQAHERTRSIAFDRVLSVTGLRRAIAVGVVLLATTAAVGGAWPSDLWIYSCRLFNPLSSKGYPTQTVIEPITRDILARLGESVTLSIRTAGVVPPEAELHIQAPGGGWELVPAKRQNEREFVAQVDRLTSDLTYWFSAGDAKSGHYQITVVHPPNIVDQRIELNYPKYMRKAPDLAPSFNVKVHEGTAITWDLKLDRPVTKAQLLIEGKPATPVDVSENGQRLRAQGLADASAPYRLVLTWRMADKEMTDQSPKHFIQVSPDGDPRVDIAYPQEDEKATLKKELLVRYSAQDDIGLGHLCLVYSLNGGPEERVEPKDLDNKASVKDQELRWPVAKNLATSGGLRVGDIVTYWLEVTDGREAKEHTGRSPSRRVQIVADGDYLLYTLARQRKFLGQLRPLYLQERDAAERPQDLVSTPTTRPAQTQPVREP